MPTLSTLSPLGTPVPAVPHAISVSFPTWQDNVDYEEANPRVIDKMATGYPRFFIHKSIQKLAAIIGAKFANPTESVLLFPSLRAATSCRAFILTHAPSVRLAQLTICDPSPSPALPCVEVHAVLFPKENWAVAKSFWQHTGLGVSSRMAERCLEMLEREAAAGESGTPAISAQTDEAARALFAPARGRGSRNRHYGNKIVMSRQGSLSGSITSPSPTSSALPTPSATTTDFAAGILSPSALAQAGAEEDEEENEEDQALYVEERYGRNLPLESAPLAKRALRRRIAGVLCDDCEAKDSERGVPVSEDDVWLFPTGMSAIWYAHQAALKAKGEEAGKSVCFGFPYTDTLKILQKWGPGAHFFGHGLDSDLPTLARVCELALAPEEGGRPILALFCEFPSNPLIRCPNLRAIRELADRHGFVVVVDETIGNFANVEILPWADIVVSSLTKVFSGETNVMGGSLILNPSSKHYVSLRSALEGIYEDTYWFEDAIFMERNSRDFQSRIETINRNAEAVCDFLRSRSALHASTPSPSHVVKEVYYPKWQTRENYDACRRPQGGFGGLFSVTFTSDAAAHAFYDALPTAKGPSLGTNFTLSSPYTILAHYGELDWAAQWGVEKGLVRISVGLEDRETLLKWFGQALSAAEKAGAEGGAVNGKA